MSNLPLHRGTRMTVEYSGTLVSLFIMSNSIPSIIAIFLLFTTIQRTFSK